MRQIKDLWFSVSRQPYQNLPWVVWGYIALCYGLRSHGGVFTGHLYGFDDHARMVQVLNWVNGAGYYDRTIWRANAPEGFTSIWARIVDAPIAFVIIISQHFVSQTTAALIAATVIPIAELAILFVVAPYFARPLVGRRRSRLICLFLLFSSLILPPPFSTSGFVVGSVSHHPWYIILYLAMFGAFARLVMGSSHLSQRLWLAASLALITAVGIEGYPVIAGLVGIAASITIASARPQIALRSAQSFAGAALASFLLIPLFQPPTQWLTASFAEPSVIGPVLLAGAATFLFVTQKCVRRFASRPWRTVSLLIGCLLMAFFVFCCLFPQALEGAGAGLSSSERQMAFRSHLEARPVHTNIHSAREMACFFAPLLISLVGGVLACIRSRGRRRFVSTAYLGFAALTFGLSEVFARYYQHAQTTACAWLVWIWTQRNTSASSVKNRNVKMLLVFVFLLPVWMILIPFAFNPGGFHRYDFLFPAFVDSQGTGPCDVVPLARFIDAHYRPDTVLIVPYWLSSQFLYHTHLQIDFLANYPSHDKYIDNFAFFGTFNPDVAREIAKKHGVGLVALCKLPSAYNPIFPPTVQSFIAQLQTGHIPTWLQQVPTPGLETQLLVFETKPNLAVP